MMFFIGYNRVRFIIKQGRNPVFMQVIKDWNTVTWQGKIFKFILLCELAVLKKPLLTRIRHGKNNSDLLVDGYRVMPQDTVAIVGTESPYKKLICFYEGEGKLRVRKIPLAPKAGESIKNELKYLSSTQCSYIPKIYPNGDQEYIYPIKSVQEEVLLRMVFEYFDQIERKNKKYDLTRDEIFLEKLLNMKIRNDKVSCESLALCVEHGDFARWNILFLDPTIKIIDWEHVANNKPFGYDLFRFLYSSRNESDLIRCLSTTRHYLAERYCGKNADLHMIYIAARLLRHELQNKASCSSLTKTEVKLYLTSLLQ